MPESETTRPRADWAKAAEGIQLAGFAVFLLLNTTGVPAVVLLARRHQPVAGAHHVGRHQDRLREVPRPVAAAPRAGARPGLARLARERQPPAGARRAVGARGVRGPARGHEQRGARGDPRRAPACALASADRPAGRTGWWTVARWAARRRRASRPDARTESPEVRLEREASTSVVFLPSRPRALGASPAGRASARRPDQGRRGRRRPRPHRRVEGRVPDGRRLHRGGRPPPRAARGDRDPDERRLQLAHPVRAGRDAGARARRRASPSTRSTGACAGRKDAPATTSACRGSSARST